MKSTTKQYSGYVPSEEPLCDFLINISGNKNSHEPLRNMPIFLNLSISASANLISVSCVKYGLI